MTECLRFTIRFDSIRFDSIRFAIPYETISIHYMNPDLTTMMTMVMCTWPMPYIVGRSGGVGGECDGDFIGSSGCLVLCGGGSGVGVGVVAVVVVVVALVVVDGSCGGGCGDGDGGKMAAAIVAVAAWWWCYGGGSFDGNSMKVAELLFKNGFKEAYAIRGGVRGENGWQAIQETLLPLSVHIYPKKKVKMPKKLGMNGGVNQQSNNQATSSTTPSVGQSEKVDNGYVNKAIETTQHVNNGSRSLSPYPNLLTVCMDLVPRYETTVLPNSIEALTLTLSTSRFFEDRCMSRRLVNPLLCNILSSVIFLILTFITYVV
ncbi:hypothetical protein HYC85_007353 [Camellia sinensis]|uniref:Rhodanese domain-containing protein n=1 Tax=Camellia sinensis TaxID=4442 RepID=A0A7J7HPY3_CAMSI|nr:hypothetical protein HYC85_007353 [Camellia sinensis]